MLAACKECGAAAVEQIRGGKDATGRPEHWGSASPMNADDTRVACTKCDNATGWNKCDVADYTRFVWNRDNAAREAVSA